MSQNDESKIIEQLTQEIANLQATVKKLEGRADLMSKKIYTLEHPFYSDIRLFTYLMDHNISLEQKKWFIQKRTYHGLMYFPDLDNPKTLNEKINWYKLYYRDENIPKCIDKYLFKDYIKEKLGEQYVVPLLGVWDKASEIDFNKLPSSFAIKSNWGSGSRHVALIKDKSKAKLQELRTRCGNWIQPWENVYYHTYDWGYKDIVPKILAEKLIDDKEFEYKIYCFDGEPKFCLVSQDNSPGAKSCKDFYTADWEFMPITRQARNFPEHLPRPRNWDILLDLARKLSAPFPHVRVDLVQTKSGILAEELTFYPGSGSSPFSPVEWDRKLGELFTLPTKNLCFE